MFCSMIGCSGHMVAVVEEVELDDGLKLSVPTLMCVGCDVRVNFGPDSEHMTRWARMWVRQVDEEYAENDRRKKTEP